MRLRAFRLLPALLAFLFPVAAARGAMVLRNARVAVSAGAAPARLEVVVEGGRIAFVGDRAPERYRDAQSIDLSGAVVYPGFVDSHLHLVGLGKSLESADLKGLDSAAACARKMAAETTPPGTWVEGDGWDQNRWNPKAFPDASVLDAVFPDRPAFARRIDGHAVWVNSAAMRAAGITPATADPAGGRIVRRGDGSPSGVFIDNAIDTVMRARPAPTVDDLRRYFRKALASCAAD
jgi:predicted amidohydrolase YtcJ